MAELLHLAERFEWDEARAGGRYERSTRGLSLAEVGYVHCSYSHQVRGVADAFYADAPDVLLLRIDPAALPGEVRVEDGFPHVYGPVPVTAVTSVTPLARDAAGRLVLPPDLTD